MAATVQFQIQGDSANFTFDVEGGYFPSLEAEYKATNPPEIIGLREVWEIRGARLTVSDSLAEAAAASALWAEWVALRARLATRGSSFPTYARFVLGSSPSTVLHTIGPSTHEGFRVEIMSAERDDLAEAGAWRTVAPVTIRVSAIQKFADTNGIVGWEQEVSSTYPDGRHRLEWVTRITTAEGTSAATKAASYAAIDASALGATYLYETNGNSGVDVVELDGDEQNSRVPTVAIATSAVRSFGVTIGTVTAGSAPSEVTYSITTKTTAKEKVTTTAATARGPAALQFVMAKQPAVFNESEILDEQALMFASGVWSQRETSATASGDQSGQSKVGLTATVTGGLQALDFEPVADAGVPVKFVGSFLPVACTVDVALERVGPSFDMTTMPLPGPPGDDWVLDAAASAEGEPVLAERGASDDSNKWTREARLVFRRHSPPSASTGSVLTAMGKAQKVPSYIYG